MCQSKQYYFNTPCKCSNPYTQIQLSRQIPTSERKMMRNLHILYMYIHTVSKVIKCTVPIQQIKVSDQKVGINICKRTNRMLVLNALRIRPQCGLYKASQVECLLYLNMKMEVWDIK